MTVWTAKKLCMYQEDLVTETLKDNQREKAVWEIMWIGEVVNHCTSLFCLVCVYVGLKQA